MKALIIIWIIASIIIIYLDDKEHRWDALPKIFFGLSVLAFIYNGTGLYNPVMTHTIATIELNPTWGLSLVLAFIEGAMLTGPISLIHIIYENAQYKKER